MLNKEIKNIIGEVSKNALDFFVYLVVCGMEIERGKGYWTDKLYWIVNYKDQSVCYVLISDDKDKESWIIWSDDSGSNCFADYKINITLQEIGWKHIDFCGKCCGCDSPGGKTKRVFGKDFDNVCRTTMKFINPNKEELNFVKKMIKIRKNFIDNKT